MKKDRNTEPVAVIFGGVGGEREISALTAANILSELSRLGISAIPIEITKDGLWIANSCGTEGRAVFPTRRMKDGKLVGGFDGEGGFISVRGAIPALHGEMGEDGVIQGALTSAGIAFVSCETCAGALLMDKAYTKLLAEHLGIPTVPWFAYVDKEPCSQDSGIAYDFDSAKRLAEKLGYPLFIKPARAGSSIGIGKAETPEQLTLAIESALRVSDGRIIVEKLIDSPTELECAYLGGQYDIYTAPGSVVSDGEPYSYDRKYSSSRGVSISKKADVSDEIKEKIKDYSKRLKVFSGLRDIGRFDYFLSDGNLYFNEVNSFPGMTESSLYPEMLALCGVSFSDFVKSLVSMLDSR